MIVHGMSEQYLLLLPFLILCVLFGYQGSGFALLLLHVTALS